MIQINASGLSWGDCQWLHHFLYYYAGLPEDAFFGKETITLRGLFDAQTHRQVEALLTEKKIPFTAGEDSPSAPQAQSSPEGDPASARVLPITGAKQITLFQNHRARSGKLQEMHLQDIGNLFFLGSLSTVC